MEKFTWDKFRTAPIAVWCRTEIEAKEFLSLCKNMGYRFKSGAAIGDVTHWNINGAQTLYTARYDRPEIECHGCAWVRKRSYTIISAKQVLEDLGKDTVERHYKEHVLGVAMATDKNEDILHSCGSIAAVTSWRDAQTDKPCEDGEYLVSECVVDGRFIRNLSVMRFNAASGEWLDEVGVVTHWLDGVPALPEVIVR